MARGEATAYSIMAEPLTLGWGLAGRQDSDVFFVFLHPVSLRHQLLYLGQRRSLDSHLDCTDVQHAQQRIYGQL